MAIIIITGCSGHHGNKEKIRTKEKTAINERKSSSINTNEEIKVYNDFIDQVYRIEYCHLEMDSPAEFLSYNNDRKVSKQELGNYKKEWALYLKHFHEMIDTSEVIAFVRDSLQKLEIPSPDRFKPLDSIQKARICDLLKDTTTLNPAPFILDSLKSKKVHFEIPPYIYVNWDKMPVDSALKYSDQNEKYWYVHVGHQVGNKYYIGAIDMSRVRFNHDSTFCILECGYMAQSKCGYGYYYILERKNNKWIVIAKECSWVS